MSTLLLCEPLWGSQVTPSALFAPAGCSAALWTQGGTVRCSQAVPAAVFSSSVMKKHISSHLACECPALRGLSCKPSFLTVTNGCLKAGALRGKFQLITATARRAVSAFGMRICPACAGCWPLRGRMNQGRKEGRACVSLASLFSVLSWCFPLSHCCGAAPPVCDQVVAAVPLPS